MITILSRDILKLSLDYLLVTNSNTTNKTGIKVIHWAKTASEA